MTGSRRFWLLAKEEEIIPAIKDLTSFRTKGVVVDLGLTKLCRISHRLIG
jgi:hypothetical protein